MAPSVAHPERDRIRALAVYPYVATSLVTLVAIGLLIGIGLWSAVRMGW